MALRLRVTYFDPAYGALNLPIKRKFAPTVKHPMKLPKHKLPWNRRKRAEEQARQTLRDAEEKLKTIQAELAEMAPGRQLIRFLRERATAEDYRRHLGLVSLVRRDFKQLSELLTATSSNDGELPKIDRIVLDQTQRLERWAEYLAPIVGRGWQIYVYANNHYAGHGPETIRELVWRVMSRAGA